MQVNKLVNQSIILNIDAFHWDYISYLLLPIETASTIDFFHFAYY